MTTQSAAALLDAAIFTMQRARAELGGSPAPADEVAPAPKNALARFVLRYDELDASDYTPAEQAAAYDESAGVLRRRAARVGATAEALAETEARARYFEARARHKRAGEPMPYALRTANEGLGYVDAFRRELVDLVELVQLIARDEVQSFALALDRPEGVEAPPAETFDAFVHQLGALIGVLGVTRDGQTGGLDLLGYRKVLAGPPAPPMGPAEDPSPRAAPRAPDPAAATTTTNGIA